MSDIKDIQEKLQSAEAMRIAGQFAEAEQICRDILSGHPDDAEATHLLAIILGQLGQHEESVRLLRQLAQLQPNSALVRHNLALVLKWAQRFEESVAEFNRAISLDPNLAPAYLNLGITFKDMMRLDDAIGCYVKALQLDPTYADAHWNLSLILLRIGDFKRGLKEYEWRRKVPSLSPIPAFAEPQWKGENFSGQTLLLFPEQGFGDAMQFARYIPMAAERVGKVVVAAPPQLLRIFEQSFGHARVVPFGGQFPEFDLQCSLMSLPLVFGTEVHSIPVPIPYLKTNSALVEGWGKKLASSDRKLSVGIMWAGNPSHPNDAYRSIPLKELAPLAKVKKVQFYSLQKDTGANAATAADLNLIDFTEDFTDFADTAAFIQNLDLVITVDTSIAHLAGAMGKKTWLLLPYVPDWRWLLNRLDSPWYPTMQLFRQSAMGQWNVPVERIANELRALPATKT